MKTLIATGIAAIRGIATRTRSNRTAAARWYLT